MATANMFYTMPLQHDALEVLEIRNYLQLKSCVNDIDGNNFHLLINRHDKTFWIVCPENLEDGKQTIDAAYHEKTITTTYKDILSWDQNQTLTPELLYSLTRP